MDELTLKLLFSRKLVDPRVALHDTDDNDILSNDDLLASVAGLQEAFGPAVTAVIKQRIKGLSKSALFEIYPAELPVYRQAMIELAALLDDLDTYAEEYRKRKAAKEDAASQSAAQPSESKDETQNTSSL